MADAQTIGMAGWLSAGIYLASFAYLLWKRQWTGFGLFLALCLGTKGWTHLEALLAAGSLGSIEARAQVIWVMVDFAAMIGAMSRARPVWTGAILIACIHMLFTGMIPLVRDALGFDPDVTFMIARQPVPAWAGVSTTILFAIVPGILGLPWALVRQSDTSTGLLAAAQAQYARLFGAGLAALMMLVPIYFAWALVGQGAFSGVPLAPAFTGQSSSALSGVNAAVAALLCLIMALFWIIPRRFIEQAVILIEASQRDEQVRLEDIAHPLWRGFARMLDQHRDAARQSGSELEQARAQLKAFFDHVPVAMSLHGLDGQFIFGTQKVLDSYGVTSEDLRHTGMQSLAPFWPEFAALSKATIKAVTTGEAQRLITPFKPNGAQDESIYDVVVFPIRAADGTIVQLGSLGIDISAQVQAQREADESRLMLSSLFDHIPAGINVFDRQFQLVMVNRAATERFKRADSAGVGTAATSFQEHWPEFQKLFAACLAVGETGEPQRLITPYLRPAETEPILCDVLCFPIRNQAGEVHQVGIFMLDVTEQQKSQQELASSRGTLQAFFDNLPGLGFIVSREGTFVAANSYLADSLGLEQLKPENLIGMSDDSVGPPEWLEVTRRANQVVLEEGKAFETEASFEMPDGTRHVFASRFPIRNEAGEISHIGGLMFDRTAEKESEREVAASNAALQAFFDNIPAMTFIIGLDRRYVSANAFPFRDYGLEFLKPENLIGQPDTTGTPEHWHPVIKEAHRTVVEDGKPHLVDTEIDLPQGSFKLRVSRFPIRNAEGEITHVGGFIFDQTAEKLAAQQVAASREALHQSEKLAALGQLLAGVAHELNNPLTVVVGRSAILEEKFRGTPHGKAIADLREAADRCNRIVRTFLAMARQSAPRRGAVQVNDAIEAALDMTAYGLRSSGVELIRRFDPALPEIEADEDQLVQVFTNLLINARHALDGLGGEPQVTITTRPGQGTVVVEVADNGLGVPAEIVSRIFEPFFTTKAVGEGTGMGLAMSRGMIEEHGGTLAYRDAKGGGAVFTVELPIGSAKGVAPEPETEAAGASVRGRVLVIDDEPPIRGLLVEILESLDLDCTESGDGAQALEQLADHNFDLVFCDVRMPVMDGVRFRERLAELRPELLERLVFISGDVLQRGAARQAAIAGHPFIEKPFNPAQVRQVALGLLDAEGDKP